MDPYQARLDYLAQESPALSEATLWIAAEHLPAYSPAHVLRELDELVRQIGANLDDRASASEHTQGLLWRMSEQGFREDDDFPLQPRSALLPLVLQRCQGQPLSLVLMAMEPVRRLDIPLVGVNFPGRFLLRVPQTDHLLDPATGRRLYPTDCRELLLRLRGSKSELQAAYLKQASPGEILQRLSRNLRQLHSAVGEPLAALKDAQWVIELGPMGAADHEARADLYQWLDCSQTERYDLERALLLSDDPTEQLRLGQRLGELAPPTGRALY